MKQDLNDNPFNNPLINQEVVAGGADGSIPASAESPKIKNKKSNVEKKEPMIDEQINHSMLVR